MATKKTKGKSRSGRPITDELVDACNGREREVRHHCRFHERAGVMSGVVWQGVPAVRVGCSRAKQKLADADVGAGDGRVKDAR
jgi:hypothetical protein